MFSQHSRSFTAPLKSSSVPSCPGNPSGSGSPARPAGFTLIELLVVIGIIAVLAALLVPVAGRVQNSARTTSSLNNMRQIHIMMVNYLSANNGVYPLPNRTASGGQEAATWRRLLWESSFGAFPEGTSQAAIAQAMETSAYRKVMWCPLMTSMHGDPIQDQTGRGSYALNRYFMEPDEAKRRQTNENIIGRVEPYLAAGSFTTSKPKEGTFYYFDSSADYPAKTPPSDHQLNYSYGSSTDAALAMFIDGHAEMIQKDKAVLLDAALRDDDKLE